MRRFLLWRKQDPTGVSGTGVVAEGCEFGDGVVVLRWAGESPTTVVHQNMESVKRVHLHGGATRVLYCDGQDSVPKPCVVIREGYEGPGMTSNVVYLNSGWSSDNGAEDANGVPLFTGQQVRLIRLHGEIANVGEITDIYADNGRLMVMLLGTDCGACAYQIDQIEAVEKTREETLIRNNGKVPSYGWQPAVRI